MKTEQPLPPATSRNERDARTAPSAPAPALSWFDCELFCISDYAGVGGQRCGWRGKFEETRWDPTRRVRPCPRCANATLMELDFGRGPLTE